MMTEDTPLGQADSTSAVSPQPTDVERQPVRTLPMVIGVVLAGFGAAVAFSSQFGFSFVKTASISVLVGAVVLLVFLIAKAKAVSP